ncbi:sigma-54-dependent Fis family transcriptional regulator [bacterium]|nr:sigma-54-dependent Fis family transcriptional regulator [bacterium]
MIKTKEIWILVADDDRAHRDMLRANLEHGGYSVMEVTNGKEAVRCVKTQHPDLVLMDMRMPEMDGLTAVKEIRSFDQNVPILIMTAFGTIENAVQTVKAGAYDYILKPLDMSVLEKAIKSGLGKQGKVESGGEKESPKENFVAESAAMKDLFLLAEKVASSEASVLITGESGTGKEVLANFIQSRSARSQKPFVKVNCAALHDQLLESELFGHEKGAFTGALAQRKGRFELADGGTIFLDEIGDMALETQAKILRVLQQKTFERLGGTQTITSDCRVISATNKDLGEAIKQGRFREDLFYRLSVVPMHIPPLRDRKEDIPPLADFFMRKHSEKNRKNMARIAPEALSALISYDWPGNVRELSNVIERAVILSLGDDLTIESLPAAMREMEVAEGELTVLEQAEKNLIIATLKKHGGNRGLAAEELGMSRRTLYNKLHRYNISEEML